MHEERSCWPPPDEAAAGAAGPTPPLFPGYSEVSWDLLGINQARRMRDRSPGGASRAEPQAGTGAVVLGGGCGVWLLGGPASTEAGYADTFRAYVTWVASLSDDVAVEVAEPDTPLFPGYSGVSWDRLGKREEVRRDRRVGKVGRPTFRTLSSKILCPKWKAS